MRIDIRNERPEDIKRIYAIEADAFDSDAEARLTNLLRDADALILSQVAEVKGEVVGHAAYSLVSVTAGDRLRQYPALGPIAVSPPFQRRGIGAALIHSGLRAMTKAGHGLLFLVGHVSYYPRFGFQPAQPLGFTSDYVQVEERHEHFMVAVIDETALGDARGHVRFHPAFDEVS